MTVDDSGCLALALPGVPSNMVILPKSGRAGSTSLNPESPCGRDLLPPRRGTVIADHRGLPARTDLRYSQLMTFSTRSSGV